MIIIAEDSPAYLFDVKEVTVPALPPEYSALGNDGSFEELCFLTAARQRGYVTWVPIGHSQKADASVWLPPYRPITVQVKRASFHGGSWRVDVASRRGGKDVIKRRNNDQPIDKYCRYQLGDFDVLAGYVPPANAFKFWALSDVVGQLKVTFRDLSTLNNWHVIEDALKA
jgi:hypothetical protein